MIGKFESNKDLIQELTSSGAKHVGNIANIITGTVAEVTREIGDWITDAIEMREAAAAAAQDARAQRAADTGDDDLDDDLEAPVAQDFSAPRARPAEPGEVIDAEVVDPRKF
ncbi:hypothetical protein LTV02_37705 [Nocardia yamanashiensis]|uniref:hypothetical protein n=1 Tax=Nocardia yamanashiensis TaxID=209247 RepID=UPI001E50A8C4|nr:hypothetical protein [Nocardia yamanashiensis]UGT41596.1 hypothetical protein LTV02_37705 [Nocardia yamanashiensis]